MFFPCVAVALWIIHFASGQGWPAEPPSLVAWLFVLIAAAAIGGGYACMMAEKGDVVLIAGKGHEDYQDVQGVKHHFDDHEVVRECFEN